MVKLESQQKKAKKIKQHKYLYLYIFIYIYILPFRKEQPVVYKKIKNHKSAANLSKNNKK